MEVSSKLVFIYIFEWGKRIKIWTLDVLEDTCPDYFASFVL